MGIANSSGPYLYCYLCLSGPSTDINVLQSRQDSPSSSHLVWFLATPAEIGKEADYDIGRLAQTCWHRTARW